MTRTAPIRRSAFTLLEVVLALGLAVMVMALVGSQVYTTLKLVEQGRTKTEKEQLARAILNRIANDLRATVRYEPFDASGVSGASASSGSGSGSAGSTSGDQSGSSTSSTQPTSQSTASSGNSSSSSDSSASSSTTSSSSTTTTQCPGLYGDPYGLQLDVARIPRADEVANLDPSTTSPVATDVRTVTYYLGGATATMSSVVGTTGSTDSNGLVRCELPRIAALYASQSGDTTQRDATATVVASEVADLQFSYFDGTTWQDTWDTTANGGLPQAISVSILLSDVAANGQPASPNAAAMPTTIADASVNNPDQVYRIVVRLQACDPMQAASSATQSTDTGSTDTSSGSTTTQGQ